MVLATGVGFPSLANWVTQMELFAFANCNAPALATLSTSCLCIGLRELRAQCHKEWSLQPVMLRQDFFTKEIRKLLRGGVVAGMQMPRNPECCPRRSWLMKPA